MDSTDFIDEYHALCGKLFGRVPESFLCPFTQEDSLGSRGLCNAHIIPQRVGVWPSVKVPQRQDVDGYFGSTLDVEFDSMVQRGRDGILGWINTAQQVNVSFGYDDAPQTVAGFPRGNMSPQSILKRGEKALVCFQPDGSDKPVSIALNGRDEALNGLMTAPDPNFKISIPGVDPSMTVESAALVRAGMLMLFRHSPGTLMGNNLLPWLSQPFANAFRNDLRRRDLAKTYKQFVGSVKFIAKGNAPGQTKLDSLESNYFLVHTTGARFPYSPPFAISACLQSPAAGATLAIMLPWSTKPENNKNCLDWYRNYQADPKCPHTITPVQMSFEKWRVYDASPDDTQRFVDYTFGSETSLPPIHQQQVGNLKASTLRTSQLPSDTI